MGTIRDLKPTSVFAIFDDITKVPRPSKKEAKIREFLKKFAADHKLECKCDRTGNVLLSAPATKGYEKVPTVVLQAHMDMVCEKNSSVDFDFEKDAIKTRIDGEWVRATGTTLGADDGIGIAAALAAMTDPSVEHGKLEALFTVDEETGLTGAYGLGKDMVHGKYLINLDSEDEGEIFIGCAGGIGTRGTMHYRACAAPKDYAYYTLRIWNLQGGHSGDDINKGRANSNKVAARFLLKAQEQCMARLSSMDGGNLHNAIPREAKAVIGVPAAQTGKTEKLFREFAKEIKAEYAHTEPNFGIVLEKTEKPANVMDEKSQKALIDVLVALPNGVIEMSASIPGLVETSTNLASVKFPEKGTVVINSSQRSSVESAKHYVKSQIAAGLRLGGFEVVHTEGYPGWEPNTESPLLGWTVESYRSLFGNEPKVKAIHAGLECGLFLEKYRDLDMVSFGPTLRGVHSPDERLEIATVEKFWLLLKDVLKRIK